MDKFEKMIKQSVEGYEAPFNPQAWENVSKDLPDSFDHTMKDATGNFEAPYNPAAWDAVSSQLGTTTAAWKWIAGAAAVIAVVAGSVYLFNTSQNNSTQTTSNNESEIVVNDNDNNIEENAVISDSDNHGDVNVNDENVEGNEQDIIHHIQNDLTVEIDPINEDENETNGSHESNGTVHINQEGSSTGDSETTQGNTTNAGNSGNQNFAVNSRFLASADEICTNSTCEFSPEVVINELKYVWNFGDGTIGSVPSASHKYTKAGEYTVTLNVINPKNNKILGSSTETLTVHPSPTPKFNWDQEYEGIPTVQFTHSPETDKVLNWNITGLKESTNTEFEYTFRKKGNYNVSLTTQNEFGCTGNISEIIKIEKDYNLLAPTAFSPDGDGKSDKFIPLALTVMDNDFTMTIYDKSGKLVYRTQNAFEPWDGRYTQDNTLAPNGTSYIWRVVLVNNNGEQEMFEGQVFVIR